MNQLDSINETLQDAIKREGGVIPYPPSTFKKIQKTKM